MVSLQSGDSGERPWELGVAAHLVLSMEEAFAYLNYGHRERQHMFRLLTKSQGTFFLQAISANDAALWCAHGCPWAPAASA